MFACLHAPGDLPLLFACAQHFSPRVEPTSADTVILDLAGLTALWGSYEQIAVQVLSHLGFPARLAIASTPDTALFLALSLEGITIVPPGHEEVALARFSVRLLPCSAEAAATLHSWGIRTLGQLAALPPLGVAARLGEEGTYLQRLAAGQECRRLQIPETPLRFAETQELDYAVDLLEPLLFVLSRLLQDLCQRLRSVSLATNSILLHLHLEDGSCQECQIPLPVPLSDPWTLLKLLQLHLSEHSPQSPVIRVALLLHPTRPRQEQHGLFLPTSPEPQKMEITLARLRKLLGAKQVGTAVPQNTHCPDRFQVKRFLPAEQQSNPVQARLTLALRRFRPMLRARVRVQSDRPVFLTSTAITGHISHSAGPWHTSGNWWDGEAWDRAEWDIALSDGTLYRIHQDLRNDLWLVEGSYD